MTGNQRKAITYHAHIKGTHANKQNTMVVEIMATLGQPQPIRMIHKAINGRGYVIDLVSLRRAMTNLSKPDRYGKWLNQWGRAVVMEAYERPCPITHKTVGWYQLIPTQKQLPLFQPNTQCLTPNA